MTAKSGQALLFFILLFFVACNLFELFENLGIAFLQSWVRESRDRLFDERNRLLGLLGRSGIAYCDVDKVEMALGTLNEAREQDKDERLFT